MLVKCYDDPILKEWYSLSGSETEVRVNDLMEYTPYTGLKLKTHLNLYQRRNSVAGTVLRVSAVAEHPFLTRKNDAGDDIGMFPNMMVELAKHMNFALQFVSTESYYGNWDEHEKKWTGILGKLESQEIDCAVSEVSMTIERLDSFDFACPIILSRNQLYIREPGSADVQWNSYLKAFNQNIWISLVVLIIVSAILLTYMKMKIERACCLKNYLLENHLYVWGIYCQQGLSEFPDSSSLRIAYVSIFFSAVVLSAIYSASIISYLTMFIPTLPFHSLVGFVNDKSYQLTVTKNGSEQQMFRTSLDEIVRRANDLMKKESKLPTNDVEGFYQVCYERVAYYSNKAMKEKMGDNIPCNLVDIRTGRIENLAFALTKDNPFTEYINYNILRFQDSGIMQRMKKRYFQKTNEPAKDYDAVGIWGIAPLLTILTFGLILSFLILLVEKLYYKAKRPFNTLTVVNNSAVSIS